MKRKVSMLRNQGKNFKFFEIFFGRGFHPPGKPSSQARATGKSQAKIACQTPSGYRFRLLERLKPFRGEFSRIFVVNDPKTGLCDAQRPAKLPAGRDAVTQEKDQVGTDCGIVVEVIVGKAPGFADPSIDELKPPRGSISSLSKT